MKKMQSRRFRILILQQKWYRGSFLQIIDGFLICSQTHGLRKYKKVRNANGKTQRFTGNISKKKIEF